MPQFKVYAAEVMPLGEIAVIITTAFFNSDGYPEAESFLIIPDEKCTIFAKALSFQVKSFQDSSIELNEEFMLQEALNHARVSLSLHLAKLSEEKGIVLPYARPNIVEDNPNLFVHLWIRGHCFDKLQEIAQKTRCELLKEKLDIVVSSLPKIHRKDL